MINIKGKNKAEILAKLYNNAIPQGMGFTHYVPAPMTVEEAQKILESGQTYFDYLMGRVMKVNLGNDELDTRLYNRDNGFQAAERALEN